MKKKINKKGLLKNIVYKIIVSLSQKKKNNMSNKIIVS